MQDFYRDTFAVKVFFYTAGFQKEEDMKTRFKKIYGQGALTTTEIWVDLKTGVNYIFHTSGYSGGLTVLLDENGKPVITPKSELEE